MDYDRAHPRVHVQLPTDIANFRPTFYGMHFFLDRDDLDAPAVMHYEGATIPKPRQSYAVHPQSVEHERELNRPVTEEEEEAAARN